MDKRQAEAIAQVILEPGLKAQEELHRKRRAAEQGLAERRKIAAFALAGALLGAGAAYFGGHHFLGGASWGGIAASAVGWVVIAWGRRRGAP
jgi:hypothetical protein